MTSKANNGLSKIFERTNPSVCVIGEVGLNHNGDMELAKSLIDVAHISGCDIAKFQKREVNNLAIESVMDAQDARFPEFGSTYREIREHLEFDFEEYTELKEYTESRGMQFLCTAFDIESADFLLHLGVVGFKLASHSLTNEPLLEYIAKTKKPTILSTGMCTLEEIDRAVAIFDKYNCQLCLLHCVSAYPTPLAHCNLKMIPVYQDRYTVPIGYSGHELGWLPTVGAVGLGAKCIERHITMNSSMVGFDHKISLNPDELIKMVREIRNMEKILGTGSKSISETEQITRNKYHVSCVSSRPIEKGTRISEDMITLKNPGTGIPAYKKDQLLGKKTKTPISKDTLFTLEMLE